MAIDALRPFSLVIAAENREILGVVIERRGYPCGLAVTGGTIGGELRGRMIGVDGLVVISLVAPDTGVRRVGIITAMTGGAVVSNQCMGAIQCIVSVVDRERGRIPVRVSGVT